jgi:GNAT superfamily N-acetyltransferase
MLMDIAAIPPGDDAAARSAYDVVERATRADTPDIPPFGWQSYRHERGSLPGRRLERFVARRGGDVVGVLHLEFPERDNVDTVHVAHLQVDPGHRRSGVGRALHAYAVDRARAAGRTRLTGFLPQATPDGATTPGAAFATAVGARPARAEARHRLEVSDAAAARWETRAADARVHADGYRVVHWGLPTPPELLVDAAYLFTRTSSDALAGDLTQEAFKADAEQIRQMDESMRVRGRLPYHAGAVHAESGRLVAWTTLMGRSDVDWHVWQSLTVVAPEHRGHRLGVLVKAENLRRLRDERPRVRAVDTYTAEANHHMNAINVALGFHPREAWITVQQTL